MTEISVAEQAAPARSHPTSIPVPVTLVPGDGIGPDVISATLRVLDAAGANIAWDRCVAGREAFASGVVTGVPDETLASVNRTGVILKGPLETPIGFGGKSANVTLRKLFEVYGNLRPARELPGVTTPFSGCGIDLIVVRENVEDLYAGIEHMQTPNTAQCLKLMTRTGCEKIVRLAFEVARAEGRKSVHCATKANIMKLSEGLMKRTFEDVAPEYPDITPHHIIIDNCAHQLVINPEQFEVIVTSNMNGDIISDLTSGLVGGLGVAPSSSISATTAIFEPVHGSAPDIAGQDKANPIAMILTAVMMLRHVGQTEIATTVENAVLVTLEEGRTLTGDLARRRAGATAVGTEAFTDAIIANLGRAPSAFGARVTKKLQIPTVARDLKPLRPRELVGVDVFMEARDTAANLGARLDEAFADSHLTFKVLTNRGTVVYPVPAGQVDTVECWTARFMKPESVDSLTDADIVDALQRVAKVAHWMHVEKLHVFDGVPGFSRAQGED